MAARIDDVEKLAVAARGVGSVARDEMYALREAELGLALESIVSDLGAAMMVWWRSGGSKNCALEEVVVDNREMGVFDWLHDGRAASAVDLGRTSFWIIIKHLLRKLGQFPPGN